MKKGILFFILFLALVPFASKRARKALAGARRHLGEDRTRRISVAALAASPPIQRIWAVARPHLFHVYKTSNGGRLEPVYRPSRTRLVRP